MSGWTVTVLVGIVWPAVVLFGAWLVGRRLQAAGDRCPQVDEWGPTYVCSGCAECKPAVAP